MANNISAEYPDLLVRPVRADYTAPLVLPPMPSAERRVAFFPGSTIGNFHPTEAAAFLRRIRRTVGENGALVLGVDRVKSTQVLNAAYNDSQGVTAAFNLNLLARINRELGADFQLEQFQHRAFFNGEARRIEMHLVSLVSQTVTVSGIHVAFEKGETIWTESSYKYNATRLAELAGSAGFTIVTRWTDAQSRFWVAYLEAA